MVLVGNKLDLCNPDRPSGSMRQVDTEVAQEFADKQGIQYFETSARLEKDGGVKEMMDSIMEDTYLKVLAEVDEERRQERERDLADAAN